YVALHFELAVLTPQTLEFLALGRGQPVRTPALVPLSLCHPVADRLRSRLELPLYLLGRATSPHQINHLPPQLRRVWRSLPSLARHRWTPSTQILGCPRNRVNFSSSLWGLARWRLFERA